MTDGHASQQVSFLSTGIVSKALGLDQAAVRAMIDSGSLPRPQYMNMGRKVERVYSLDWLLLASEQLNLLRLPGMESYLPPLDTVQIVLRFDEAAWTIDEVAVKLETLKDLWTLCFNYLNGRPDETLAPPLHLRRLSAGSPLDVLIWVSQHQGLVASVGVGTTASLFMFLLKVPQRAVEAIPRLVVAWKDGWASVHDAEVRRLQAKVQRRAFEKKAEALLQQIDAIPAGSALSGDNTMNLDLVTPTEQPEVVRVEKKKELPHIEDSSDS